MTAEFVRLLDLASPEGARLTEQIRARYGNAVASVVGRFVRILALRSPDADNFVLVGAQVTVPMAGAMPDGAATASVGGTGADLEPAFVACAGEAIELLAGFERPGDITASGPADSVQPRPRDSVAAWATAHLGPGMSLESALDWVAARDAASGAPVLLPADLCLRRVIERRRLVPRAPLSIGCAAGATIEDAQSRAVLELVERDAAALWWAGGRRGRPLADGEMRAAADLVAAFRGGATGRRSWILDLTTDLEIPAMAAISVASDGRGMACGLAARARRTDAIEAAVREMLQVELAYAIIAIKVRAGRMSDLLPPERRHLARATEIDAAYCSLIHPFGPPAAEAADERRQPVSLTRIIDILSVNNIDLAFVDLCRTDLGLAAARAVAPQLQTDPASLPTDRLANAIRTHGGGAGQTRGVELF